MLKRLFNRRKFRKGLFIIVYRRNKGKFEFLIQKRKLHWKGFEFPKGGIEKGETKVRAMKREIHEEVGLSILSFKNLRRSGKWLYGKDLKDRPGVIGQTFSLFSVEVGFGKVKLDRREHYSAEWLGYRDSMKKLTYDNQKECLKYFYERFVKKK